MVVAVDDDDDDDDDGLPQVLVGWPSESLWLRVKSGRVDHSWCMGCSQSWLWWVKWEFMALWDSQEGLIACREMPEHFQSVR